MTGTAVLARYHLLGRTGLRVSPLALGAMTFGEGGWHAGEDTARSLFRRYLEAGGNFVDTAINYGDGRSEELLGTFMKETGSRQRMVVATKFTFPAVPGDPNAGGNGRKNMLSSLETSLRRLQSDYVDLYWLHAWDGVTPVEEVMSTFDMLVRSGKVRAVGLSNVPAWYATKAQLTARGHGWEPVAALQLEYSLAERAIEREHVPAAADLGIGIIPWSPLANGLLTGKYAKQPTTGQDGANRLTVMETNGTVEATHQAGIPTFTKLFTDDKRKLVDLLAGIAREIGHTPAQVALNWVTRRPGVVSTLIGATRLAQLDENLAATGFEIPAELTQLLDEASRPEPSYPYYFQNAATRPMLAGD